MKTTRILVCALLAICAIGDISQATTYYFTTSGSWSNSANWQTGTSCSNITGNGQVPSATDDAVICASPCNIDNANAVGRTVDVTSGKTLAISGGYSLTLGSSNSGNGLTSHITGTLTINSTGTVQISTESHTFDSTGHVQGNSDNAIITVDSGLTFTNSTTIQGHLQITGSGKLLNKFTVSANGGTLLIKPAELDDDISSSNVLWRALIGGTLRFDNTIGTITGNSLSGDFTIATGGMIESAVADLVVTGDLGMTGGELDVIDDLTMGANATDKLLDLDGGTIKVWPGKTFTHE